MTYDQVWWPILGICACIYPIQVHTHSSEHTHTHHEHTPGAVGRHFYAQRPGISWGFGALLKGTSVVVLRVERALYIHSPTYNSCRTWDSNSQPLDYESNSLTIRPRLPHDFVNLIRDRLIKQCLSQIAVSWIWDPPCWPSCTESSNVQDRALWVMTINRPLIPIQPGIPCNSTLHLNINLTHFLSVLKTKPTQHLYSFQRRFAYWRPTVAQWII